jgi:hypothetical protein
LSEDGAEFDGRAKTQKPRQSRSSSGRVAEWFKAAVLKSDVFVEIIMLFRQTWSKIACYDSIGYVEVTN